MGMVGLRGDLFVVAPASSFHHQNHNHQIHHHATDPMANTSAATATATATALGVGVIPLLTGIGVGDAEHGNGDRSGGGVGGSSRIQFWQNPQTHHHHHQNSNNYLKNKSMVFDQQTSSLLNAAVGAVGVGSGGGGVVVGDSNTGSASTGGGSGGGGGGTTTCQDCGNQAKKDCSHRRCRTCCKSRNYECATHVRSTWVPASRRRERQMSAVATGGCSSGSTSGVKKPRLIASQTTTSHTSTSNSFDTTSSHQDGSFREALPGQVRAPAVFKCVRVTAIEDGEDEFAYQAVVRIGGHVFKGFLYDQGVEGREGFPDLSELHLGAGSDGNGGGRRNGGASSTSPIMDPSDVYGASSSAAALLGAGAPSFGNPIN
ncbi:hypothetical protein Sjap_002149 [Stephania japonica]|uniref:Uncharacterized protein n=1 Tax=Stephania japonica TaxID=461633 RepID=A0AAP0KN37_9MAGN